MTNIIITIILLLMCIHFIADFWFQTDELALNKSTSNMWLAFHSYVYAVCFCMCGFYFTLLMFVSHFIIDGCSSRMTSILWKDGDRHWFFVVIGFDQLCHTAVILYGLKTFILPV